MAEVWRWAFLLLPLLAACSREPATGPVEIRWDRDTCEHCRMVISDRRYAAEVRVFPESGRSKVYKFDDIGCAIVWLRNKPWWSDSRTRIWVKDEETGAWLNARQATYVKGRVTPMDYGLGARREHVAGGLDFDQAVAWVMEQEKRFNEKGIQLLDRLRQQAERRRQAVPR